MAIELIIVGLRRSGTTVFWQLFRQDPALRCYDEPFNPHLGTLPTASRIKHPEEFRALLDRDPVLFWRKFAPIHFSGELQEGLSDRQAEWLRWLGESADRVALDATRCHFKIADLAAAAPQATLVYLYRPAASLATSHLLPSASGWSRSLRRSFHRFRHRAEFWTRPGRYDGWSFESIIGDSPQTLFGQRLREAGIDPERVYARPAVARLLAYWKVCDARIRADGERHFGERFLVQEFDAFCADPEAVVRRIYRSMRREPPARIDTSRIHPPNGPYDASSPRWTGYLRELGIEPATVE